MKIAARRATGTGDTARIIYCPRFPRRALARAAASRTTRVPHIPRAHPEPFARIAGAARGVLLALAACGAVLLSGTAHADELTGTLKKIHDDGVIALGVREASIPFSYFDGTRTVGYSQAIAMQIVDEIRKTLGIPQLRVHEVTVTSANRAPMLMNNQIDLECGSTTHTVERENVVAFSDSFFQYAVRMITRKNSGITDFADLAAKPVVTTAGTSDERLLRRLNTDKQLNMRILSTRDHQEAFTALKEGRAVAFVMDEPIVYGFKAADPHPDDFVVTGTPLGYEVYACMFRKGDEPFRDLVNRVIAHSQTSGDAERLYKQWFTEPIPPLGINLNFPMSESNRALFAHPNDRALD
ncbi:transporter substrate-binding domain-containing protein [Paraburkholderia susongensis]|uniref:Amino acid ABC transporter substrate-binding protein, PAAT family n=1 Tax=Paraburkholderia susongensis TaxID=1515439 RepID=A0A1X7IHX3_9BURK|nr:transporter substrate-binding domain-containing protein [Paraburkholderia susongensis]SMG13922.1 amino acid ABC transporter substrate-binding protein, PAAT family [Paraburkholderia susongensis]